MPSKKSLIGLSTHERIFAVALPLVFFLLTSRLCAQRADSFSKPESRAVDNIWYTVKTAHEATQKKDYARAEQILGTALAEFRAVKNSSGLEYKSALGQLMAEYMFLYGNMARYSETEAAFRESVSLYKEADALKASSVDELFASAHVFMGIFYRRQNRLGEAERMLQDGVEFLRSRPVDPGRQSKEFALPSRAISLGNMLSYLGSLYRDTKQVLKSEETLLEAVNLWRSALVGTRPDAAKLGRPSLVLALKGLGTLYLDMGRYAEAAAIRDEEIAVRREMDRTDSSVANSRAIAEALLEKGGVMLREGSHSAAESTYREAYGVFKELYRKDAAENAHGYFWAINGLNSVLLNTERREQVAEFVYDGIEAGKFLLQKSRTDYREPLFALLSQAATLKANRSPEKLCPLADQMKDLAESDAERQIAQQSSDSCKSSYLSQPTAPESSPH